MQKFKMLLSLTNCIDEFQLNHHNHHHRNHHHQANKIVGTHFKMVRFQCSWSFFLSCFVLCRIFHWTSENYRAIFKSANRWKLLLLYGYRVDCRRHRRRHRNSLLHTVNFFFLFWWFSSNFKCVKDQPYTREYTHSLALSLSLSLSQCERVGVILHAGTIAPFVSVYLGRESGCHFHVVINLIGGIGLSQACFNHTHAHIPHIWWPLSLAAVWFLQNAHPPYFGVSLSLSLPFSRFYVCMLIICLACGRGWKECDGDEYTEDR